MNINEWISEYAEDNDIEIPEDIGDTNTVINFLNLISGSSSTVSKPTANDVGKILRVEYGNEPDVVIIPETTFVVDDGNATPNPIPNANIELFTEGIKVICEINGEQYEANMYDDDGLYIILDIGTTECGIYKDEGELYFWADLDGEYILTLYRANVAVNYEDEYDIIIDEVGIKWYSNHSLQEIISMIESLKYIKTKVVGRTVINNVTYPYYVDSGILWRLVSDYPSYQYKIMLPNNRTIESEYFQLRENGVLYYED